MSLQIGDIVELISLEKDKIQYEELFSQEKNPPKIGDTFTVKLISLDGWIKCEGLEYFHPQQNFKKVNK
jgi:hypothetical protein